MKHRRSPVRIRAKPPCGCGGTWQTRRSEGPVGREARMGSSPISRTKTRPGRSRAAHLAGVAEHGRRAGLKIRWAFTAREGSSPSTRTPTDREWSGSVSSTAAAEATAVWLLVAHAGVAKLADAPDLGSGGAQRPVRVRLPPPAPQHFPLVAQLEERWASNPQAAGSSPAGRASVLEAQLDERPPPKRQVPGSNPGEDTTHKEHT